MGVLPQMVGVLPTYGTRRPFLCKIYKVVLFLKYHVFHNENICMSRIRGVFGYELVSKSFIHWLYRYEYGFLGWASCPTLPYKKWICKIRQKYLFCVGPNELNDIFWKKKMENFAILDPKFS